jgi:hypothetical protein
MKKYITSFSICSLVFFLSTFSVLAVCDGDLNCDGSTDGSDLAIFAGDFGQTGCDTCDDLLNRIDQLENRIAQLESLLQNVTRSGNDIYIDEANLHIRNGSDSTANSNGLGNLIVGYNELRPSDRNERTGSHNIVVGMNHNFSSYGGLVVGLGNTISGRYAAVTGGSDNTASGNSTSITGGFSNTAEGEYSSISGGVRNKTTGSGTSITGGQDNLASGGTVTINGGKNIVNDGGIDAIDPMPAPCSGWCP